MKKSIMKKLSLPFSLSLLCSMLVGCGGGSNNIFEDPVKKPAETTAVGCTVSAESSSCFEFLMEYPVAGLQYTCTSDKINTFITQQQGNSVTGGCNKEDTVTFFLNANDTNRIEFGQVKLSDLGFVSAKNIPVHLTVLDMARGLTGKSAQSLTTNDETTQVALQLIKILQAVGTQKTKTNQIGDVQLLRLRANGLADIEKITDKVDLQAFQNGSYVSKLKPWVDVSTISDAEALAVLQQISHTTLGAIYQADPPVLVAATEGLIGYTGTDSNRKTLLGSFFLMSDRQGYTHGYGIQWRGIPERTGESVGVALDLLTQSNPLIMRAKAQENWINILNKRIGTGEKFKFVTSNNENMIINQGRLINDYGVAGSDAFYKFLTNQTKTVVKEDLATWTQSGAEQFTGKVDFVKAYPISYLDRQVFRAERTVESKDKYYFPLYATLTFRQDNKDLTDIKLGIVIDEFGDIRTDMGKTITATDMSGQCGTVADPRAATFVDNFGVQQYRIGTISATNYQPNQQDITIAPRIILSGSQFGLLDGNLLGVNSSLLGTEGAVPVNNNGAKINLYNLITSGGNANINISNYQNGAAEWVNLYHSYKKLFIDANSKDDKYTPTEAEKNQVKAVVGGVTINLASCYSVKTKA